MYECAATLTLEFPAGHTSAHSAAARYLGKAKCSRVVLPHRYKWRHKPPSRNRPDCRTKTCVAQGTSHGGDLGLVPSHPSSGIPTSPREAAELVLNKTHTIHAQNMDLVTQLHWETTQIGTFTCTKTCHVFYLQVLHVYRVSQVLVSCTLSTCKTEWHTMQENIGLKMAVNFWGY